MTRTTQTIGQHAWMTLLVRVSPVGRVRHA